MAAVEEALPALHHEKVVYLDALAQARVVAGNIKVMLRSENSCTEKEDWKLACA